MKWFYEWDRTELRRPAFAFDPDRIADSLEDDVVGVRAAAVTALDEEDDDKGASVWTMLEARLVDLRGLPVAAVVTGT